MGMFGLDEQKTRLLQNMIMGILVLAVLILVPYTLALSKGEAGEREIFSKLSFFVPYGIGLVFLIMMIFGVEMLIRKGDETYGDGLGFYSPGQIPHMPGYFFKNPGRVTLLALLVFSVAGLLAGVTQQTFFGVGQLQQQFTKFDNIVFSSALVATAENLGAAAVLALTIFGIRFAARKYQMVKANFYIVTWISGILAVALFGVLNHLLRYGTSDYDLINVAFIWGLGGLITMATGSFIAFWMLHIVNNIFYDLGRYFGNDVALGGIVLSIILLGVGYGYYEWRLNKKKRNVPPF